MGRILEWGVQECHQVLCFAGVGIFDLREELHKFDRDSHSVLGSLFLNPTVGAGRCVRVHTQAHM